MDRRSKSSPDSERPHGHGCASKNADITAVASRLQFQGFNSNAEQEERLSQFSARADREGFADGLASGLRSAGCCRGLRLRLHLSA
jgi:hypothetical protein